MTPAPAVVTPSPATAATPTTGADGAAAGLQLSQLQSILSQMGMEAATETGKKLELIEMKKKSIHTFSIFTYDKCLYDCIIEYLIPSNIRHLEFMRHPSL